MKSPRYLVLLDKLGLTCPHYACLYFPYRYEDEGTITSVHDLQVGQAYLCEVVVEEVQSVCQKYLTVVTRDNTAVLYLRFLNTYKGLMKRFVKGKYIQVFGIVRWGNYGCEMVHPRLYSVRLPSVLPKKFSPIYPTVSGLSQTILQKNMQRMLAEVTIQDHLPEKIRTHYKLWSLSDAIHYVHTPPLSDKYKILQLLAKSHVASYRLIFDEHLAQQLAIWRSNHERQFFTSTALRGNESQMADFIQSLPFVLTLSQKKVWKDISQELQYHQPMHRLLQGDVGSGKTIIAVLAIFQAICSQQQVVFMVPTELLAEQHYQYIIGLIGHLGGGVALLTSQVKTAQRKKILAALANGEVSVLIGTQAVIQEQVVFCHLALIIIDEQHRFGVQQRLFLRQKSNIAPHQLMMSATPIPRTLLMAYCSDMQVSTIEQMPIGRVPIDTCILSASKRQELIRRINIFCTEKKNQVYWVCPLIEESEKLGVATVLQVFAELQAALPHLCIGLLHSKLSSQNKKEVMWQFQQGVIDIIVTTTVIEVGINVANANVIVIEHAEKFGLAQLHQLRGRVGRGLEQGYCILLYVEGLSDTARLRLSIIRSSVDGFFIAQQDLAMRGSGDFLGVKQSGHCHFYYADCHVDEKFLQQVVEAKNTIIKDYPTAIQGIISFWQGKNLGVTQV